jgi:hypothetical protein
VFDLGSGFASGSETETDLQSAFASVSVSAFASDWMSGFGLLSGSGSRSGTD